MRLDATDLRYVTQDEFRVLQAVETGSRNHEIVPTSLIAELSGIRSGIVTKCLSSLSKRKLVGRVAGAKYEGFRLTYGGLDWLSLRTFSRRKPASVAAVGNKIGVGKESDIYVVKGEDGVERVLKLHRLGRISFRNIKEKRDYLGKRKSGSWMFMSRLSAQKEFTFMKVLYENGFPVPTPVDQARHCIVMSLIDGYPMRAVSEVDSPSDLFAELMALLLRLAHAGLVHGDFNEFNIMLHKKTAEVTLIDFPQMVSTRHVNAEFFFNRDVLSVRRFFKRRFRYEAQSWPTWKDVLDGPEDDEAEDGQAAELGEGEAAVDAKTPSSVTFDETSNAGEGSSSPSTISQGKSRGKRLRLDEQVEASGWAGEMQKQLEEYMAAVEDLPPSDNEDDDDEDDYEEDEDEDDDDDDAEDDEEGAELEGVQKGNAQAGASSSEPLDEEAFQAQMAARLESIRLNKALGNDDEDDEGLEVDQAESGTDEESSSEEDSDEEDADAGSDGASLAAQTDYTTYQRPPKVHKPRVPMKKLGQRDIVRSAVESEMRMKGSVPRGGGGGGSKVGKAKGHKWKSSSKYLVGKDSGW